MNDVYANNILTKSIEDSLTRIFQTSPAEVSLIDTQDLQSLFTRLDPSKKCEGVYFDYSTAKGVSVIPTYEEIENISRFLFDFKEKTYAYKATKYVVNISPDTKFYSIREVVASILEGIDKISCPMTMNAMKAMLLDKAIEEGMVNTEHVFIFKNGAKYNITCTPLILPFIVSTYESQGKYCNTKDLLGYLTSTDMRDEEKVSLLVQYGYLSDLPVKDVSQEETLAYKMLFNNLWTVLMEYPLSKDKITSQYNRIINNSTAGEFEKSLAKQAKFVLDKNNGSVFDSTLADIKIEESVKTFFEIKKKGYSELELDELRVELETNCEYSEDKMYLVTRIHKDLATARRARKKAKNYEIEDIDNFINELKVILKEVQNKKIKTDDERFQVIVKYPKGDYEE